MEKLISILFILLLIGCGGSGNSTDEELKPDISSDLKDDLKDELEQPEEQEIDVISYTKKLFGQWVLTYVIEGEVHSRTYVFDTLGEDSNGRYYAVGNDSEGREVLASYYLEDETWVLIDEHNLYKYQYQFNFAGSSDSIEGYLIKWFSDTEYSQPAKLWGFKVY